MEEIFLSRSDAIVQAAFAFPAEVTELAGVGNLVEALGGDAIPDRNVPLGPERVVGKVMGFEVSTHFPVGPFEDREKLPAGFLAAENLLFLTMFRTGTAQAGQPDPGTELGESPAHRLDPDDLVKLGQTFGAFFP